MKGLSKNNFLKKTKSCAQRTPVYVKKSNCFARRWTYSSGEFLAARVRSWMLTSSIYFCWPRRTSREKSPRKINLAGCWAHARRNFYEARQQAPQRCGWILRQIAHLYRIEENLRRSQAGPRKRAAVRRSQSRLIFQRLYRALVLFKKSRRYLPRSTFGQAIDYALSNWSLLGVYLEDGRLELDNNLVENAIRPTAVGKKNWLFFGDAEAGQRSAILYTIIESCRCRGIDPYVYLRDVLTRLPSMTNWQVKDITPEAWEKTSRSSATATAA